jgi:hydrogenase/urease accessory protein HupE
MGNGVELRSGTGGRPMTRQWRWNGVLAVVFLLGCGVAAPMAHAHWADQAAAEIVVVRSTARMTLTVPTSLLPLGDSQAGRLSDATIGAHREDLRRFLDQRIRLLGYYQGPSGANVEEAGKLTVEPALGTRAAGPDALAPATHTTLALAYAWSAPITALYVRYDLFVPNVSTASCLATILHGTQVRNVVFTPEHRATLIDFGRTSVWQATRGFIALGIDHILSGYDHMLFLLSLLMLGGSLRQLIKIVTAFTVAHSVTLSLAVLNIVALPSRWVESAIALSIIYVAAENVWRGSASLRQRWMITFGFGLVHGLGFASVLQEMHLPQANVAASLVGFNLGVEVAQIIVVTLAYLALDAVRNRIWAPPFRRVVSVSTALVGIVWFVQRAFLVS